MLTFRVSSRIWEGAKPTSSKPASTRKPVPPLAPMTRMNGDDGALSLSAALMEGVVSVSAVVASTSCLLLFGAIIVGWVADKNDDDGGGGCCSMSLLLLFMMRGSA